MNEPGAMRASDGDRQAAVDRLAVALGEGRLSLLEYDERIGRAYSAVTYADLSALFVDLSPVPPSALQLCGPATPATGAADPASVPAAVARASGTGGPPALTAEEGRFAELPTSVKVLWTVWLTGVLINLAVWALVSAGGGSLVYFWPAWVAVPAGAALLGLSTGARHVSRGRRENARRRQVAAAAGRLPAVSANGRLPRKATGAAKPTKVKVKVKVK